MAGKVTEVIYLGTSTRVLVDIDDGYRLNVLEQNASSAAPTTTAAATAVVAELARPRHRLPRRPGGDVT